MRQVLDPRLPDLATWDGLDAGACETVARDVARGLPPGWSFSGLRHRSHGDQSRHVAFFDYRGSEFTLLPGDLATLGYDRDRPPRVDDEDFRDYAEVMGLDPEAAWSALLEHFDQNMTPLRTVRIAPFLAETHPRDFSGAQTDRGWDSDFALTLRQAFGVIRREGFRLPTVDEWEYACGAGSRTFWQWGHGPPTAAAGPNAFGLRIAESSYECEWCVEPDTDRGGDGGGSCCGGEPNIVILCTIATSYKGTNLREVEGENFLDGTMTGPARRILSVLPRC